MGEVGVAVPHLVTAVTDEEVCPSTEHWATVRVVGHSEQLLLDGELPGLPEVRVVQGEEEGVIRGDIATFPCRPGPGDVGEPSTHIA